MSDDTPVNSVVEYLECLRLRQLTDASAHGSLTLFRGQENSTWDLLPGIARPPFGVSDICTDPDNPDDKSKERRLFIVFRDHAPSHLPQWVWTGTTEHVRWKQIAVAQHYRLPTRFLDWTSNPLVALFFACERVLRQDEGVSYSSVTFFRGKETTSIESLARRNTRPPVYEGVASGQAALAFVRPPDIDHRITAQSSFFSISADPRTKLEPDGVILVPEPARQTIRTQLNVMGFNRKNLFPGLEGIADHLKWDHLSWK